jgi:outer membrane autotransporter protein
LANAGTGIGSTADANESDGLPAGSSLVILDDLRVKVGGTGNPFALFAQGNLDNAIVVTGDVFELTVSGGVGARADRGAKIFIGPAGGMGSADDNSLIVLNTPGASVQTDGDGASGLVSRSSSGNARLEVRGGRISTGTNSAAANAEGIYALVDGGNGSATILFEDGTVTTNGFNSDGIVAHNDVDDGDGSATVVMTGGSVTTSGDGSAGLLAQAGGFSINPPAAHVSNGNARVVQSGGTVKTSGDVGLFGIESGSAIVAVAIGPGLASIVQAGGTAEASGRQAAALQAETFGDVEIDQSEGARAIATGADASGILLSAGTRFRVNLAGLVQGGQGSGIHVIRTRNPGFVGTVTGTISVAEKGVVEAASGLAVLEEAESDTRLRNSGRIAGDIELTGGSDQALLDPGSVTQGRILMGDGSDETNVASGADISGVTLFDGGDDVEIADGFVDFLTFAGGVRSVDGATLTNWEGVSLTDMADFTLTEDLATGAGTSETKQLGFFISDGSVLRIGGAGAATLRKITGDLTNHGAINLQNMTAGDRLSATGNYAAASDLLIDTYLGDDASPSDLLAVGGDTSGATSLFVNNTGGPGAQTSTGIMAVDVGGASNGTFVLANPDFIFEETGEDAIIAGAYGYVLRKIGGDWFLQSTFIRKEPPTEPEPVDPKPIEPEPVDPEPVDPKPVEPEPVDPEPVDPKPVEPEPIDPEPVDPKPVEPEPVDPEPVDPKPIEPEPVDPEPVDAKPVELPIYQPGTPLYESYPGALLGFMDLPSLRQRVGDRHRMEAYAAPCSEEARVNGGGACTNEQPVWARVAGWRVGDEPQRSTSGTVYDENLWILQAGVDALLRENRNGVLFAGLTAHYGEANTDISSLYGDGSIRSRGYGIGATLTWYGNDRYYFDAEGRASWLRSDLASDVIGRLADENNGFGYALRIETGHRVPIGNGWSATPQAQLSYAAVSFDSFVDPFGAVVSSGHNDSLRGRLGMTIDYEQVWESETGNTRQLQIYGLANLFHEFLNGTQVDVSGTAFSRKPGDWTGEVGIGGTYSWNDAAYSLYGELRVGTGLSDFGEGYRLSGNAGLRVKF